MKYPESLGKAITPGLLCPACGSSNTEFIGGEYQWVCDDCLECFPRTGAKIRIAYKGQVVVGRTEDGSHWCRKKDGEEFYVSKELMKTEERQRIQKWPGAGYDPVWSFYLLKSIQEIEQEKLVFKYFQGLSEDQLKELKESLS